jgi:hypothetical protein
MVYPHYIGGTTFDDTMNGYSFFRVIRGVIVFALLYLFCLWFCIREVWHELSREASFRGRYGAVWRVEYENSFGSLSKIHTHMALGIFAIVAFPLMVYGVYRVVRSNVRQNRNPRQHRPQRQGTPMERAARYRRNAVLGVYFGLGGIASAVALVMFHWGIFADHANEAILGYFVFAGGYVSMISGCWYWLRVKEWTESVILIGVMPLGILFIPYVRLLFLAAPLLLPAAMVMMSLILVTVVFVLPDKSGTGKRGISWSYKDINKRR